MTIRRRSLIKGVAASAALPFIPKMPAIVGGTKTALAASRAWATHFDGTSGLTNNASIKNMPAQSNVGLFAYSWRSTTLPSSGDGHVIMHFGVPASGSNHSCAIDHLTGGDGVTLQCQITVAGVWNGFDNQTTFAAWTPVGQFYDGNWHTNMIAIDSMGNVAAILIDGVSRQVTKFSNNGEKYINFQSKSLIARHPAVPAWSFIGDLVDATVFAGGSYINPNDEDVLAGFYDMDTGYAVRKASSGDGIVSGQHPQVHLSGPAQMFPQNFAAGTWNVFSDNTNGYTDTNPTSAFTVTGTLTDADTDPFEP
jgi:hypothetical protein